METKPDADATSGTTPQSPSDPKAGDTTPNDGAAVDRRPDGAGATRALVILLALVVVAVLFEAIVGEDDQPGAPTASPNPTPSAAASAIPSGAPATTGPGTPTELLAEAGATEVRLTWAPPTEGSAVAGYVISRDGQIVATVGPDQLSFVDRDVQPVATYGYQVAAYDADANGSPSPATMTVRTTQVPATDAWLNGPFDVQLSEESHFGYGTFGDPPSDQRWSFASTCADGPCRVGVTVRGVEGASFALTPIRSGYGGTFRTDSFVRCGEVPITTVVKVHVVVMDAADVDGVWTATRFSGEVTNREAPQNSCDASGVDFTAVGTAAG